MGNLALGCMRLSEVPRAQALAVLHGALDRGVRLLDTADVYGPDATPGHNERLVREALDTWGGRRDEVRVATKVGLVRRGKRWLADGRRKHVLAAAEASAARLGRIDLLQLHAPDPAVPWSTSVRALAAVLEAGLAEAVGVGNCTLSQLEEAAEILPIGAVQAPLDPLEPTALWSGVAEWCAARDVPLLAYRPFGGTRRVPKVLRHPVVREVARDLGWGEAAVVLAWLRSLHPVLCPLPGPSRLETLEDSLATAPLPASALRTLDAAFPASRRLRLPPPPPPADGEVVVVMGIQGAGKSTAVAPWVAQGYLRLNRDLSGGTLAGTARALDTHLTAGERRIVVDNTYPSRESRGPLVDVAWRHGIPLRCVWLDTPLHEAQVNVVQRLLALTGALPGGEALKAAGRVHPNVFAPRVLHDWERRFEAPSEDEGFASVSRIPFERRTGGRGAAVLVHGEAVFDVSSGARIPEDPRDIALLDPEGLRDLVAGRPVALLLGPPWSSVPGLLSAMATRLGAERALQCAHAASGQAECWCRKPLPGLGVRLLRDLDLDPARCTVVGASPPDRTFAARLGIPYVSWG